MNKKLWAVAAVASSAALLAAGSAAADPNYGRNLAANCASCHGTDGRSVGSMPSLAGLDRNYLVTAMQDFRSGKRPSTVMSKHAKGYTDEQIEQIAAWFAAQRR